KHHLVRHHIGVDAAANETDVQRWRGNAGGAGAYLCKLRTMRVETGENGSRSFERIDPGLRHGGMRLLSRDRYVEVQATVMRGHHRIGKSCCNHSVGFCQLLFQEP